MALRALGCAAAPPPTPRDVVAHGGGAEFCDNTQTNTKYTVLSFIPRNLWEQFSRPLNQYFLFIACLQLIPSITPVNPLTTWLPLLVIFGITTGKEAVDEYGRAVADRAANSRVYTVVRRGGARQAVASRDIHVGDVLLLSNDDEVPADCVLLGSSEPRTGACFLQTTNLDGESNLKPRSPLPATLPGGPDWGELDAVVTAPPPDDKLYSFDAVLTLKGARHALSSTQLLLQATHVRNTEWVAGLVVYAGGDTKYGNSRQRPATKYTRTDDFVSLVTGVIFALQLGLVVVFGALGNAWSVSGAWYLLPPTDAPWWTPFVIPARFLLLNSTIIPISLKLSLDLCKAFYAYLVVRDVSLYDASSDTPAGANSSSLGENLGQVTHVLSDKTGTLTENRMVLRAVMTGGVVYRDLDSQGGDALRAAASGAVTSVGPSPLELLRCIALNNDVVPVVAAGGERTYRASSPDEEALVKGAATLGVALVHRAGDEVVLEVGGVREAYTQLGVLAFDSDRKRMSVLVQRVVNGQAVGSPRLYCKGADDVMMQRLAGAGQASLLETQAEVDAAADIGLRTLVYAFRDVPLPFANSFLAAVAEAGAVLTSRSAALEAVYTSMEAEMLLTGATAIEDKLQEGVPDTVAALQAAGIRVWMLTGDKFSTALTIARNCKLTEPGAYIVEVDGDSHPTVEASLSTAHRALSAVGHSLDYTEQRQGVLRGVAAKLSSCDHPPSRPPSAAVVRAWPEGPRRPPRGIPGQSADSPPPYDAERGSGKPPGWRQPYTLIIRGASLAHVLSQPSSRTLFGGIACGASAVIACRVTPRQKADLVTLVAAAGHLTLAVGDGGNDVAMIQAAAVGVGILGQEGLQAARAADYTLPGFKGLGRLLLVHGRNAYYRTSLVVLYSFYKSFTFCAIQLGEWGGMGCARARIIARHG